MSYTPPAWNAATLRFRGTYTPPAWDRATLPFGANAGGAGTLQVQTLAAAGALVIAGLAATVQGQAHAGTGSVVEQITGGAQTAQIQTVDATGTLLPPPPPFRGPAPVFRARWREAAPRDIQRTASSNQAPSLDRTLVIGYDEGTHTDRALDAAWGMTTPVDVSVSIPSGDSLAPLDRSLAIAWDYPAPTDAQTRAVWGTPEGQDAQRLVAWSSPPARDTQWTAVWNLPPPADIQRLAPWTHPPRKHSTPPVRVPWEQATPVPYRYVILPPYLPPPAQPQGCYSPPQWNAARLGFRHVTYNPPAWDAALLPFRCRAENTFFIGRSLSVENTCTVVRLPERTPLNVQAVSLSADLDSFAWSISLRIADRASLTLVLPDPETGPHSVEIAINGHLWTGLIERYQDSRRFGDSQYTATGRSRTALLAAPFEAPRAYISDSDMNAQQLAQRELEFSGFSLDWQAVDWLVPEGAFAYDNLTPMEALTQIASSIGATVQAHPSEDSVRIVSRYPVSPWAWDASGTETSAILDANSVLSIGLDWQPGAAYQGVYVSGRDAGVLVQVIRDGTAGTPYAPLIVDPLILALEAGTERGRIALALSEDRQQISLVLPLLGDPEPPGLLEPGELIEVQDPVWGTYRALVTATAIEASQERDRPLVVRQRITIWRQFRSAA